jgi:type II secretory pathway pseudopilin PulG
MRMAAGGYREMDRKRPFSDARLLRSESGVTLVEMAVVLVVIGLIIFTIFPAINAVRMSSQRSTTQSNLQSLMLATAAYVQANGCLPCPTPAGTIGAAFGLAGSTTGTGASKTSSACGTCSVPEGIPPFISLGIPASTAEDGWGRWITMRVDPALTGNATNFTVVVPPTKPVACACSAPVGGACTATPTTCTCSTPVNSVCTPLPTGISQQGLCTANLSKSTGAQPITVTAPSGGTQQAAVIFVSHGSNGYGSYVASALSNPNGTNGCRLQFPTVAQGCPQALSCPAGATGLAAAECNASGTANFVNAATQLNGSSTYDDLLAYADRNTLVSMFGNGACQTVW